MMLIDTKYRTDAVEMMDDFSIGGSGLYKSLDKISLINRMLGGNSITLKGVRELIKNADPSKEITIVDLGCGNGDMLRMLAKYAARNGLIFRLTGIDANADAIRYARKLSVDFKNISYNDINIFSSSFANTDYDIALCTLTIHHFKDDEIVSLLEILKKKARMGIVINDLHRSALAYRLFQMISFLFRLPEMPKEDGLVSILRGFKKQELVNLSKKLHLKKYSIQWRWAFRYQWIIPLA